MKKYASELAFTIPQAEIDHIWQIYSQQSRDIQLGMIERFRMSAHFDEDIITEAYKKLKPKIAY